MSRVKVKTFDYGKMKITTNCMKLIKKIQRCQRRGGMSDIQQKHMFEMYPIPMFFNKNLKRWEWIVLNSELRSMGVRV